MEITKKKVQKNNPTKEISALDKIKDEKLRETLILIKKSTHIKINYNTSLTDSKDIEEYFKEELGNYLDDRYKDIYEKVSELREKGYDMMVWTFKLMQIPLKIKLFLSTCDRKDFNAVTNRLNEVYKEVNLILEQITQKEENYKKRKLAERKLMEAKQKTLISKKIVKKKVVKNKNSKK